MAHWITLINQTLMPSRCLWVRSHGVGLRRIYGNYLNSMVPSMKLMSCGTGAKTLLRVKVRAFFLITDFVSSMCCVIFTLKLIKVCFYIDINFGFCCLGLHNLIVLSFSCYLMCNSIKKQMVAFRVVHTLSAHTE